MTFHVFVVYSWHALMANVTSLLFSQYLIDYLLISVLLVVRFSGTWVQECIHSHIIYMVVCVVRLLYVWCVNLALYAHVIILNMLPEFPCLYYNMDYKSMVWLMWTCDLSIFYIDEYL